jgi:hypothetical protein
MPDTADTTATTNTAPVSWPGEFARFFDVGFGSLAVVLIRRAPRRDGSVAMPAAVTLVNPQSGLRTAVMTYPQVMKSKREGSPVAR